MRSGLASYLRHKKQIAIGLSAEKNPGIIKNFKQTFCLYAPTSSHEHPSCCYRITVYSNAFTRMRYFEHVPVFIRGCITFHKHPPVRKYKSNLFSKHIAVANISKLATYTYVANCIGPDS